jgi:hypothetical protein
VVGIVIDQFRYNYLTQFEDQFGEGGFKRLLNGGAVFTKHGTPYSYDTHVPVILFGAGVAAGSYATVSSPADIAPTLSLLLKVEKPSNAVGRILTEAIR